MENISLYNISNRFIDLFNKTDLTPEEAEEQENELVNMLMTKSNGIVGYSRNIDTTIEAVQTEIDRLKKIKEVMLGKKESFYDYVKVCMERLEVNKIETPIGNIVIGKNPMSVEIVDETKVPEKYKIAKTTISIDKNTIKSDFKETGEVIEGVNIIDDKTNIKIK